MCNSHSRFTGYYTDFEPLQPPVTIQDGHVHVTLATTNDEITLEYNDMFTLYFTPQDRQTIEHVESNGEYIRYFTTVQIIDNDSKLKKFP